MSLNGGYAMIKYNSTQEELEIAYKSKRPALFYDENQRAHWAVIEETATQSVDEETQEPITIYEYSYKLLDEASAVVANPTLSGDEATLNGLEVDGTKYKVGGSGGSEIHLYGHYISTSVGSNSNINLAIYSNSDIPFQTGTLVNWIKNNGFSVSSDKCYVASGYYSNGRIVIGIGVTASMLEVSYMYINDSNTLAKGSATYYGFNSITDKIIQIF